MAEENENAEVVVEETTPATEEVKTEAKEEVPAVEEKKSEDGGGDGEEESVFDANAFADVPLTVENPEKVAEGGEEKTGDEEAKVEDGDTDEAKSEEEKEVETLDWKGYDDDEEEITPEATPEATKEVVTEEAKSNEEPQPASTDAFKQVVKELGINETFENIEQFKEHLELLENENNKLRASSGSTATNEAIQKLQDLQGKDNEELVKLSLEKDGFEGDELQDAVDKYIDNGLLEIEAKKIRNTINNAIVNEQNKVTQSTVEADAKQQQEHAESVRLLEDHLNKTETMFGFAMAKDKESLSKVQKGHLKYITSGKFMSDVYESEASVSEVAWFVKNRDTIINAISNKSLQQGKEAILNDIGAPEVNKPTRFKDPKSNEFDPKAFTYGNEKK